MFVRLQLIHVQSIWDLLDTMEKKWDEDHIGVMTSYVRRMNSGTYPNMKILLKDSSKAFMEKLDADSKKLNEVHDQVSVREYITTRWFYNDLGNELYRIILTLGE